MKSRLLLEEPLEDDLTELDPDEAAEQLVERLARYAQFKSAAGALRERWEEHAGRLYRCVPVPSALRRRPSSAGPVPPATLVDALAVLLREPPRPDTSHLADLAVSLIHELRRLRIILGDEGRFTFAAVASHDRIERAVTFFALLELHSSGEAVVRQTKHLGDILVTRGAGGAPLLAAASSATAG
ncbi:MAG TPA: hypothetical protein VFH61_01545, partial [Thermoleophilia bacterium]|nr:hypothetical protein [Thermoleophilia bacterium]